MTTQDLAIRYQAVKDRREACKTALATLQGTMDERRRKREALEAELQAEGIDVSKLEDELKRVTAALEADVSTLETETTTLEAQVNQAREQIK